MPPQAVQTPPRCPEGHVSHLAVSTYLRYPALPPRSPAEADDLLTASTAQFGEVSRGMLNPLAVRVLGDQFPKGSDRLIPAPQVPEGHPDLQLGIIVLVGERVIENPTEGFESFREFLAQLCRATSQAAYPGRYTASKSNLIASR